jgi:GAF domain-containing protein
VTRDDLLVHTFVELTDSLVDEFDIIDLLTVLADRCVKLQLADETGILLADDYGNLRVMAASSEATRLLELFQLQNDEGPCLEAYATGETVSHPDLGQATDRWPRFAPEAVRTGFVSVNALPLRLRSVVIGAINLFSSEIGGMPEADQTIARALADVAAIAILQDQALRQSEVRAGQLQHALDSRVTIEQAKGMVAERTRMDMVHSFELIRTYARSRRQHLTQVAAAIVDGTLSLEDIASQD